MQSVYTNLGVVLAALIATLAASLIQYFTEKLRRRKYKSYDLIKERGLHEQVNQLLVELLTITSAERVYVSQFHNGTVFLGSSSDIKKSRTFERVKSGAASTADKYQDLRVSLVGDEMKFLETPKPIVIYINTLEDTKFRRMMEMDNVFCTVRMPIRQGNQIIGYLGLDFSDCEFAGLPQKPHCHEIGSADAASCCRLGEEHAHRIERASRAIQELISQMRHHL